MSTKSEEKPVMITQLRKEYAEIRKVSTPWCAIRTTDYMSTIMDLLTVKPKDKDNVLAGFWTVVDGVVSPIRKADGVVLSGQIPTFATSDDPPFMMLKGALNQMPEDSVLFVIITDNTFFDNPYTVQAISNVRDTFKSTGRTLVFLGTDPILPPFLAPDIPILDDPLPTEGELTTIAEMLTKECNISTVTPKEDLERVSRICLGMGRFSAEEAMARKFTKQGIDFEGLNSINKRVIENSSNQALLFEKEKWTFDNIGGMSAFKDFMRSIFVGPKSPSLVVRIDEIDKSISAASAGTVADNTGVSQDILRCLLTALEDNSWMGLLAVGGPGTGKTLSSICTGNEFGARTLSMDLGAVKGSLVGESEGKIRKVISILKAIGGNRVLFMATANRLDTLPPELQRRFWLGTWFWDLPSSTERKEIWKIQRERFSISEKYTQPNDTEWTGSDVRNCCQMSWVCSCSLEKASEYITLVGKSNKTQIESLRDLAEKNGFRSVVESGPYKRKAEKVSRKIGAG